MTNFQKILRLLRLRRRNTKSARERYRDRKRDLCLIQRAFPLTQAWMARMDRAVLDGDADKCRRILRHMHRIREIQARANARTTP